MSENAGVGQVRFDNPTPRFKKYILSTHFKEKCIGDVVRIGK